LMFVVLVVSSASGQSKHTLEVSGVKHASGADQTRISIGLSGQAEFAKGRIGNPERVFIDLKGAVIGRGVPAALPVNDGLVKGVRIGQFDRETVRVVVDIVKADYDYRVSWQGEPSRLVIDISSKTTGLKTPEPNAPEPKIQEKKEEVKQPVIRADPSLKRRVVIDAGHGGHDPGAVGRNGLYEKNVVLDVALRVRQIMAREYPLYEIMLTRDKDVFLPLDVRASIANKNKADLFVSIHANASTNRNAKGIETYLLNWTNDIEAMKVAARENAISLKKMKQVQSELGFILASLEREAKRNESVKLAGNIQNTLVTNMRDEYSLVTDLGVKQALFYVLVGAKMPSALVEVSFISNPIEETLLSRDHYRQALAESIARGIHGYFSSVPQQKTARSGGNRAIPASYTKR
ncbi:MAG TPA: N-acetylmuramoyl-L-alanine amidase, partial [Dissulfurispiraceae bacterium]|nr:N-acetylmuramoyl-L-alanine amidase [Dissulfurispiraceae bacterium]